MEDNKDIIAKKEAAESQETPVTEESPAQEIPACDPCKTKNGKPLSKRKQKALEKKAKLKAMTFKQRLWYEIKDWAVSILIALVAVLLLKTFIGIPIRVDGHSMDSTLADGERLLVTAYDVNLYHGLEKGDVVICHYPGRTMKWLGLFTVRTDFVKRLVGVPGDTVKRVNGVTYINDIALDPSNEGNTGPYGRYGQTDVYTYTKDEDGTLHYFRNGSEMSLYSEKSTANYHFDYEYVLGEDEYFVVGDNRYNSHDCRAWNGPDLYYYQTNDAGGHVGPISYSDITGHVRAVILPLDDIRSIANDPNYLDPRDCH